MSINCYYFYRGNTVDNNRILQQIKRTESPLKRQLLIVALISKLLKEMGKDTPVVIGGCALSYYTREVYFTADIDLAYADRESLNEALKVLGYKKEGRYWVNDDLKSVIEVPASVLVGEESPIEIVEFDQGLQCKIIGVEDLIIDRLNACKYWKSEIDCEMVELLLRRYFKELDWVYLERQAKKPANNTLTELLEQKRRIDE
jgi:hypothetical protein